MNKKKYIVSQQITTKNELKRKTKKQKQKLSEIHLFFVDLIRKIHW